MYAPNSESSDRLDQVTLEKPTVLVVDDSNLMRKAIAQILEDDFRIVSARDGEGGWQTICRDYSIQVVFCDLMMPIKNGFQLLREIRESIHARINQLPVIIITSHEDDEGMKRRAMSLGASDFISKPFDSIQIKARAKSYAKHGDTTRRLEHTRRMLEEKSTLDTLTGLPNPRYFMAHGPGLLAFATRQGTDVAVLRIDIDRFNQLVRQRGRAVADKILINTSKIVNACVRKEDDVARVGDAKLAVVMPGADAAAAKAMARRIHELINKAVYRLGTARIRMTASAGLVCNARNHATSFEDIVKLAEERLNQAIKNGGAALVLGDDSGAVTSAEPPPIQPLTLDEALVLLKAGQPDRVHAQLKLLIARVYPLLVYGNKQLRLGMDASLTQLRERLRRVNTDLL
jgi:two-component system cell cycle response regulator